MADDNGAWWVTCKLFTVKVVTREGTVIDAAPIVKKFIGKPFSELLNWAGSHRCFAAIRLKDVHFEGD